MGLQEDEVGNCSTGIQYDESLRIVKQLTVLNNEVVGREAVRVMEEESGLRLEK